MTDRIYAYTVILEKPLRDDDAEAITAAIRMIKGVVKVTPLVADGQLYFAVETARRELGSAIMDVIYPRDK